MSCGVFAGLVFVSGWGGGVSLGDFWFVWRSWGAVEGSGGPVLAGSGAVLARLGVLAAQDSGELLFPPHSRGWSSPNSQKQS